MVDHCGCYRHGDTVYCIVEVVSIELSGGNPILDDLRNDSWFGVIGGLITGLLQFRLVTSISKRGAWWIVISTLAWEVAWLACINTGVIGIFFAGGILLGLVTGIALLWLLRFPV